MKHDMARHSKDCLKDTSSNQKLNTIIGYTFLYSSFLQYSFILDNHEERTLSRYVLRGYTFIYRILETITLLCIVGKNGMGYTVLYIGEGGG